MSPRFVLGVIAVLCLALPSAGRSQTATGSISGIITDQGSLAPVSSAQVHIPTLQIGSLTQANGRYLLLNVPVGTHQLRVERIGYRAETLEVTVTAGQAAAVNVALVDDALALDEIIVTGTAGQARRREVGNTIAQVRVDDTPEPVANLGTLLQGRMPGVVVREGSGMAGSAPDIRLRGNVSVAMSNQPLIYIDGVRAKSDFYAGSAGDVASPLNDINPADIDRIEIVKGPAATTLYGTEAASGVIQIFTKSAGSTGAPVWTAETRQGFSFMRPFGPDTDHFGPSGYVGPGFENGDTGPSTPNGARYMYLDPVFHKGKTQAYNLSVRGGAADRLGYYISGGWDDSNSPTMTDYEKQLTLRGNIQFRPIEDLMVQFNNSFSHTDLSQVYQGNSGSGIVMTAYRGEDSYIGDRSPETLRKLLDQRNFTNIDRFVSGLTINYTPTSNFTHRVTLGHDYSERAADRIFPYCWRCDFGRPGDLGSISRAVNQNRLWSLDYVGSLVFDVMSNVRSSLSFGVQGVQNERDNVSVTGSDLPGPGDYTINAAARLSSGSQTKTKYVTGGFFVQDQLAFGDRFFLVAGLRVDGNSAFGSGFGLQPYPKLSGSYVISDEGFWPASLGTMKLRSAYGWAGRAPGTFDAVRTWTTSGWGTTEAAFTPDNPGNPDLGPERTSEIEAGFDASALNNRLSAEVTWYTRTTTDALFNVSTPTSDGNWASQRQNVGKMKNWGWEFAVSGTVLNQSFLSWDLGANISISDSEILSLGGASPFSSGGAYIAEGLPVGVRRGNRITNWYDKAEPIIEENAIYGPGWPNKTVNANTSFTLPGQVVLSGRVEFNGGHYITNGAESLALQRSIPVPKCFNAYQLNVQGKRDEMYAWERAQCFGMTSGSLNTVPGDLIEVRDITLTLPISGLLPSLTSWSQRMDLTISGRNLWYKKDRMLVSGHPEQSGRTGDDVSLAPSNNETLPVGGTFTVALRAIF